METSLLFDWLQVVLLILVGVCVASALVLFGIAGWLWWDSVAEEAPEAVVISHQSSVRLTAVLALAALCLAGLSIAWVQGWL